LPERVQLRRTKFWRMPPDTIMVSRPSIWGNPFRVGVDGDAAECVAKYRQAWEDALRSANAHPRHPPMPFGTPLFLGPLRGKHLACWCPLDQACHADVLLELANR
jgi:hypothetical protein